MTREEAIKHIKDIICENNTVKHSDMVVFENEKEALRMAIKALSQEPMRDFTEEEAKAYSKALDKMYKPTGFNVFNEPCDDAISREEAIKAIKESAESPAFNGFMAMEQYLPEDAIEAIQKLPSVTQKSGKWIYKEITDDYRVIGQCSECKECRIIDNYCPNCGARMESEDKDSK